jgi:gluconate 2-dehydrogenase alpha chain
MAQTLKKTDVVIVGLGAGGGVAALPLARAGLKVIGLEAGGWLTFNDFPPDQLVVSRWPQIVHKANFEVPTTRPNSSVQTGPPGTSHPMMNAVGGTSIHYWAQHWRLNPWDFKVVSETTKHYGASRIPAGSTVQDWPFGYDELEPYYDKVEYEVGVSGNAGNIQGTTHPRGNIFEGPRARHYPMPALLGTGYTDLMDKAAGRLGWHPFRGPAAITSTVYEGRPPCEYHGYCGGAGCPIGSKSSTSWSTIPKAQQTGNFKVMPHSRVTEIVVDDNGRATGVNYVRQRHEYFQPADAVLLASYNYENIRLLLLSKSKAFPNGLGNNSGQVGRHYFSHNTGGGVTVTFPFELNLWYGMPAQGTAIDDWGDDNFDHSGLDFIGGGLIWTYTGRSPMSTATTPAGVPTWGSAWKSFVANNADRTPNIYLQKTTLPYEGNYVDLDPVYKDQLGLPVPRITGTYRANEAKLSAFIQQKVAQLFTEAGANSVAIGNPVTATTQMTPSTHAYGGTRMGDDAATNVVDRYGFSHECPNVGVVSGSVMGTSGCHNPTETIQALGWRTAEHLAKNWKNIVA